MGGGGRGAHRGGPSHVGDGRRAAGRAAHRREHALPPGRAERRPLSARSGVGGPRGARARPRRGRGPRRGLRLLAWQRRGRGRRARATADRVARRLQRSPRPSAAGASRRRGTIEAPRDARAAAHGRGDRDRRARRAGSPRADVRRGGHAARVRVRRSGRAGAREGAPGRGAGQAPRGDAPPAGGSRRPRGGRAVHHVVAGAGRGPSAHRRRNARGVRLRHRVPRALRPGHRQRADRRCVRLPVAPRPSRAGAGSPGRFSRLASHSRPRIT